MRKNPIAATLADEAYSVIRERIVRGDVGIGQVISRRKIAAELGMSFLPVSEAFLRLEFEGLLESRPRAGTRVRIPSSDDVRGHYIVREALEVQAAKLVAENATMEEFAELIKLAQRVDAIASQADGDRPMFLTLHARLHRRIAECSGCQALCDALEKTAALSSIWLCIGRIVDHAGLPVRRHQDLIEALASRDPQVAAEVMREHIFISQRRMLEALEPYFELGEAQGQTYSRNPRRPVPESVDARIADLPM
jgi:DNA-binding GntR family transcriptional regulator